VSNIITTTLLLRHFDMDPLSSLVITIIVWQSYYTYGTQLSRKSWFLNDVSFEKTKALKTVNQKYIQMSDIQINTFIGMSSLDLLKFKSILQPKTICYELTKQGS